MYILESVTHSNPCLGAEPDERNSQGLTAFHVAVQLGYIEIMKMPFFENYPPKESEHSAIYSTPKSTSVLYLALESQEPEVVWMILDQNIAKSQDISNAWTLVSTGNWKAAMKKKADGNIDGEKLDEIRQLLMTFGGFTPPPTPKVGSEDRDWDPSTNTGSLAQNGSAQTSPSQQKKKQSSLSSPEQQFTSDTQPQFNGAQIKTSANGNARGRGRGRGRARARGK